MGPTYDIKAQFERHWPIIQGKLIEKGYPLSKLNINTYRAEAFKEYVKNYNNKIIPEINRRNKQQNACGAYQSQRR